MVLNMYRNVRNELKKSIYEALYILGKKNISFPEKKNIIISVFSAVLLKRSQINSKTFYKSDINKIEEELDFVLNMFHKAGIHNNINLIDNECVMFLVNVFIPFLEKNSTYIDDILSWTYQLLNEKDFTNRLSNTQFFTEKYMIKYLVDNSLTISKNMKILDPACGGGNFLIYIFDFLLKKKLNNSNDKSALMSEVENITEKIYGYDLDKTIAVIADINLKLKILTTFTESNIVLSLEELSLIGLNIYASKEDNIFGALDNNDRLHKVLNVSSLKEASMKEVFTNTDQIFTNPPFQGIKGMDKRLNEYLKTQYPNSKCDLCNAFIEKALNIVNNDGNCGLVTQNSWLFLDSFADLRKNILENYSVLSVADLGSNSFYNLSGEKSNVSLVILKKAGIANNHTKIYRLKNLAIEKKAEMLHDLSEAKNLTFILKQTEFCKNINMRMEYLSFGNIKKSFEILPTYGQFAKPMQGTSTGDSANLIDYFWNRANDIEWVLVSKGGGYCKWNGLNNYKLLWGTCGEYIKSTPGSALRNIKYFDETDLVFSDTGTSGLNVRLLKEGQIFVASGPGIRSLKGNKYAHLALLNSRLFSYYLRILSPKLTIAAGYIAAIPTVEKLLYSKEMANIGHKCCELKDIHLKKRVVNYEFEYLNYKKITCVDDFIKDQILADMKTEIDKLLLEKRLEKIVMNAYGFTNKEIEHIYQEVGKCAFDIVSNKIIANIDYLDETICKIIDENCTLKKCKSQKALLGIEGVLEWLAIEHGYAPMDLFENIKNNIDAYLNLKTKYLHDLFHKIILKAVGYGVDSGVNISVIGLNVLLAKIGKISPNVLVYKKCYIKNWIEQNFNHWHMSSFKGSPILIFDGKTKSFLSVIELEKIDNAKSYC